MFRLCIKITSSNFLGTSDSGIHSTDTTAFPPGMIIANAGAMVNGPTCNRPCVGASLEKMENIKIEKEFYVKGFNYVENK